MLFPNKESHVEDNYVIHVQNILIHVYVQCFHSTPFNLVIVGGNYNERRVIPIRIAP
jgi:hypothetical protein